MRLRIFIDNKSFECLKKHLPAGSACLAVIENAVHFANIADKRSECTTVFTCDDVEARDLLMHARGGCLGAATRISEAFRAAGLTQ